LTNPIADLPPRVSLDLSAPSIKEHPIRTWRRLQRSGSLVRARIPLLGTPALATRRATAREVLEDESRFTVDATRVGRRSRTGTAWWLPAPIARLADNLLVHEGEEHRRRRRQVDHAFRRVALDRLQPVIEERVSRCLDVLARSPAPCFVRDVARPLPLGVISDLLGLDAAASAPGTALGRSLERLSTIGGPLGVFRAMPALRHVAGVMAAELAERRRRPREDLLSALVHPIGAGAALDEADGVAMVFMLYLAGHETTTHLISLSLLELLRSEAGLATLPARPEPRHVSELVRATSPVELTKPRFVVQDTVLDGHRLPRGSTIAVLIGAANHDDSVWSDPERIDPNRSPTRHLGFGSGTHACLGMQLALRETASVFEQLATLAPRVALHADPAPIAWARRTGLRALRTLPLEPLAGSGRRAEA